MKAKTKADFEFMSFLWNYQIVVWWDIYIVAR